MRMPKYRRFAARDIGFVEWNKKRYYFAGSKYGSKESWQAYLNFCNKHCVEGKTPTRGGGRTKKEPPSRLLVVDLADRYLEHAESYYGSGQTELAQYRRILVLAVEQFGHLRVDEFGPLKLAELRDFLANNDQLRVYRDRSGKETGRRSYRLRRQTVNHLLGDLKRVFKWGVTQELVSGQQWMSLQAVPGLRAGRTTAKESTPREPVSWAEVKKVLPKLSDVVRAMVQVQWHTGCRPQQVRLLRPCEIDRSVQPWEWRPGTHKNTWRGKELTLWIGPQAQKILKKWLDVDPQEFCFSPRGNGGFYGADTYAKAILYGISALVKPRIKQPFNQEKFKAAGLVYWTPHQLRHAKATAIREQYGLEAAQAVLGHASLAATQIYAKKRVELAREIAGKAG